MKYKMIAVDMDGTLLTKDKKITKEAADALKAASAAGILVIISTGRATHGVEMYKELPALNNPVIILNGAQIIKYPEKKFIYKKNLPTAPAAEILARGKNFGTTMCIWCDNTLYGNVLDDRLRIYETMSGTKARLMPGENELLAEGITKILWFDTKERTLEFDSEMPKILGDTAACCMTAPEFLEFFNTEVSKGAAIELIAKQYGIKREEIVAIGDGGNDIEMLVYAGLGIAMENAADELKKHAVFVTKSNSENGVAYAINKILKGEL